MQHSHKAVVGEAYGPPGAYALQEVPTPVPGPGEVLIIVAVAGVSFVDVLIAAGGYQVGPSLPYTPGTEYAGTIVALGQGVVDFRLGDRVCATGMGGGYAEYSIARTEKVVRMPPGMTFDHGAVFLSSYTTAYHALVQRAALSSGETVLILGAGGAVGIASIQIAKMIGARVIASASGQARQELARFSGADALIETGHADWRTSIKALTDGVGVDVVVDPVGGAAMEAAFRTLRWRGRHLVIGFAAGEIGRLPANLALVKGASLIGVDIRRFGEEEPKLAARNVDRLMALFERGELHPPVARRYPLDQFVAAMEATRSRDIAGRILLDIKVASETE
jgi:NADPH2:quinone reductase